MAMDEPDVLLVLETLEGSGVPVAVAGGWAIDALVGRVTRDHGDLDLAIDVDDVERAIAALGGIGVAVRADERPARIVLGDARRSVDLHPVRWDATGTGRQQGFDGEVFVYPPGSTGSEGRIGGRPVRCLSPELLMRFHFGYEPRDIDRRDMATLATHLGIPLPEPYG